MEKIYPFSNENLTESAKLFNFDNAKVLSVLGSGDQYFTSCLNGAKEVTVFDSNPNTWPFFVLKFMALRNLSYEAFYRFFITCALDNERLFLYLKNFLPDDIKDYFEKHNIKDMKISNNLFVAPPLADRITIPYFNEQDFYKLQEILKQVDLPEFICSDITEIPTEDYYDIALFSNIYHYLGISISEYREFLKRFNCSVIQAHYSWLLSSDKEKEFLDNGFTISTLNPALRSRKRKADYVVTLEK